MQNKRLTRVGYLVNVLRVERNITWESQRLGLLAWEHCVYELAPHLVEGIKEGYKRNLKRKIGLVHLISQIFQKTFLSRHRYLIKTKKISFKLCKNCQAREGKWRILGVWVVTGNTGEETVLKEKEYNGKIPKRGCWERQSL